MALIRPTGDAADGGRGAGAVRLLAAAAVLTIVGLLAWAVLDLRQREPVGLAQLVAERVDQSGVGNEVTAVLLNFRSYDTLLEVGVLLLAAMAVLAVRQADDVTDVPRDQPPGPMLGWLVRIGVPVMVLGAGYLLWAGSRWPGGAFQAGAVLGGAGVVLRLGGWRSAAVLRGLWLRVGLAMGFAAFALVAVGVMLGGQRMLEYPTGWATALIVGIEVLASVSIGLTLALLFIADEIGRGGGRGSSARAVKDRERKIG